jgi:putative membrane protein
VDGVDTNGDGVVDNGLTLGLNKIAAGLRSGDVNKPGIAEGLASLVSGLTNAVGGVQQLATGAGSAYTGSKDLAAGTGQIATGSTALAAGVKKIAEGNKKLSDGLPAAADGSGAIAEGLGAVITGETAVGQGLSDVNTKAVAVLQSQFKQGTALARQQLAGLDASTALVNTIPGAANTTWVLSQTKGDITARLASGENDSNMARNLGLGAGGVLLLLGGIAGGFVSGRKASVGA